MQWVADRTPETKRAGGLWGGGAQGSVDSFVGRRHRVCRADTGGRLPAAGVGRWVLEAGSGLGDPVRGRVRWAWGRALARGAAAGAGEGPGRAGLYARKR